MNLNSKMKCRVVSLREITLVNIAGSLHNLPRIKEKLWSTFWEHELGVGVSYSEEYNKNTMKEISNQVAKFIQEIETPVDLKVKIVNTVEKISIQIMKWISYHKNIFTQFKQLPAICRNSLHWSLQGLINKEATAESLVKNQMLDISNRFKIACIYCLEAYIHTLWSQIPESIKSHIQEPQNFYLPELVKLWKFSLMGKLNNLMKNVSDFHYFGFIKAVQSDNEIATIYFWQKLQPKKKEEILTNFTENFPIIWGKHETHFGIITEYYADIVHFMMSQMNTTQQVNFMKQDLRYNRCSTVLSSFLSWPYQDLFIQMLNKTWSFLSLDNYNYLFYKIVEKIVNRENDYNYRSLLREFWNHSPNDHKMSFLKRYANEFLSIYLGNTNNLVSEDVALIVLILKDATSDEKANFNFDFNGKYLCCKLIKDHQWMLVEILAKNCLSSVRQKREFTKDVVMSINEGSWFTSFITPKKLKELEQFIRWCLIFEDVYEEESKDIYLHRSEIIRKFYWWCIISVKEIDDYCIENKFEIIDGLISWCFSSPGKFIEFKKEMIDDITKIYNFEILDIISKDKLEVIKSFVVWCLPSEVIDKYKKDLMFSLKAQNEFKIFIYKNGFEWSKKLITWCFCSDEEYNQFKIELVHSMKAEIEFHNFIYEDKIEIINDFIIWCLSFDDDVSNFKKELFYSVKNGYKMYDLMYKERWHVIERFITWCSSSEIEISLYKTELIYSIKEHYNFRQSIYKADFRWIKRIIDWGLSSQEAKNKFNVELIHSIKTDREFLNLLYDGKLDLIDDFISWCLKSKIDIVIFKKELLFLIKGDSRFKDIVFDYRQDFLEKLVDWCLSTEEEKITFKSELIFFMRNDRRFLDSIYKGKLNQIEIFLFWCLPERAACKFKKELIYEMKDDRTFNNFIYEGKFDLIENFINFFLETEKEVREFKAELITFIRGDDDDFKEIIYKCEFEWIKNFISLCCSSEMIKRTLKMELLHFMKNDDRFHDLLYQGRIKVVGGFIAWCLSSDSDVHSFKKELIYIMMKLYGFKKLICWKKINLITKIVTWCLSSKTEIVKFKSELMESFNKDHEFTELICQEGLHWVKIFISWCCSSKEEKDEFKRGLIYFMFEECQLQKLISREKVNLVQQLTTWCLPSEEIDAFNKKLFVLQ